VHSLLVERMITTQSVHNDGNVRRVYYLSLEFLMGRLLINNLYSAGVFEETERRTSWGCRARKCANSSTQPVPN
jgi:glycogen phosphorylase